MRRIIVPLTALAAVLAMLPGVTQAASLDVDVVDIAFEPRELEAVAGDTITWTWGGSLQHNVNAYSGATFGSPTQRMGTFSTTFPGGTVLYRCTLHSSIDQGSCTGMCGLISNDISPPAAPQITQPSGGATVSSPVQIRGTAPGAATVVVREGAARLGEAGVAADGTWALNVARTDGTHTIDAVARSALGIQSPPSAPVTFTVDATPPHVTLTSPSDLAITGDPILAAGTASDERSLAVVRVILVDLLLGSASVTVATVDADGTWTAAADAPHPGPYSIYARAHDVAGNESSSTPVTIVVGLPG